MLKDIRGRRIEVGSKVVWPGRQGSNLWMTAGEVVSVRSREHTYLTPTTLVTVQITHVDDIKWNGHRLGTRVTLSRVENIVVVG